MKPIGLGKRRPLWGGAVVLILAGAVVFFAFGVPAEKGCGGGTDTGIASVQAPLLSHYSRVPKKAKNPVNACRAAGGVCVGLEAGACARGPIGDAKTYACGEGLQCCLPEGQLAKQSPASTTGGH